MQKIIKTQYFSIFGSHITMFIDLFTFCFILFSELFSKIWHNSYLCNLSKTIYADSKYLKTNNDFHMQII